eukprot:185337-Pyramimonas_sp.AAC.1
MLAVFLFDICRKTAHPTTPGELVDVAIRVITPGHLMSSGLTYQGSDVMLSVTRLPSGQDGVKL